MFSNVSLLEAKGTGSNDFVLCAFLFGENLVPSGCTIVGCVFAYGDV